VQQGSDYWLEDQTFEMLVTSSLFIWDGGIDAEKKILLIVVGVQKNVEEVLTRLGKQKEVLNPIKVRKL